MWKQPSKSFLYNKLFSNKKKAKSWKSETGFQKISLNNFTKIETSSQVASKNFAKILIYLSGYISINSEIVTSKFSETNLNWD